MPGICLQGLFTTTLTILCLSTGSARWITSSYTTASSFLKDEPGQLTNKQTALIPWVQSIVIQHLITTLIRSSSIGNTLIGVQRNNPQATMMASLSLPSMWMYSLMTIISIKTVRTSEEYHLCPFLGKGGSRPEPEPPPTPPPTGHKH